MSHYGHSSDYYARDSEFVGHVTSPERAPGHSLGFSSSHAYSASEWPQHYPASYDPSGRQCATTSALLKLPTTCFHRGPGDASYQALVPEHPRHLSVQTMPSPLKKACSFAVSGELPERGASVPSPCAGSPLPPASRAASATLDDGTGSDPSGSPHPGWGPHPDALVALLEVHTQMLDMGCEALVKVFDVPGAVTGRWEDVHESVFTPARTVRRNRQAAPDPRLLPDVTPQKAARILANR